MLPNVVSLEKNQQTHNKVISAIGNNSASNDHTQHKHDLNSKLIASADAFAAGRKLGMSEEETVAAMSRMMRRQRRADDGLSQADAERQLIQSANSIAEVSSGAEIQGVGYENLPEVDAFGQDQGQFYDYGPDDMQYEEQQSARMREQMADMEDTSSGGRRYDRGGNVVLRSGESPVEYDELAAELDRLGEARTRDAVAPQSVLSDALGKLEAAKTQQSGFQGALSRVFGGQPDQTEGIAQIEGRLEQLLDPSIDRAAQGSLVGEMVRNDAARQNYRRAAYNTIMGQIEAEGIGERLYQPAQPGYVTTGQVADESLAGINRTGAGASFDLPIALQTGTGPAVDATGSGPLGSYGPVYTSPNTDPSADLNAPMTTRAWMVERQPEYSDGGRSFGNYPQVDVTGATTLFANRLRGLQGFENVSPNIRGVGELQTVIDRAAANPPTPVGGAKPITFATREPVTDAQGRTSLKSVRQQSPDVRGLLSALRYTPAQESQLANAMYQMEVAKATQINQQGKQQYYTRTGPYGKLEGTGFGGRTLGTGGAQFFSGSPEAIDPREGQANVARINPGQTIEGRDIKTALGNLADPEAAKPFYGAVSVTSPSTGKTQLESKAGPQYYTAYNKTGESSRSGIESVLREKEERNQVNRAKKSKGRIMPVDEDDLRGKVEKATIVQERSDRDNTKRADQMSSIIASLPPNARRTRIR